MKHRARRLKYISWRHATHARSACRNEEDGVKRTRVKWPSWELTVRVAISLPGKSKLRTVCSCLLSWALPAIFTGESLFQSGATGCILVPAGSIACDNNFPAEKADGNTGLQRHPVFATSLATGHLLAAKCLLMPCRVATSPCFLTNAPGPWVRLPTCTRALQAVIFHDFFTAFWLSSVRRMEIFIRTTPTIPESSNVLRTDASTCLIGYATPEDY